MTENSELQDLHKKVKELALDKARSDFYTFVQLCAPLVLPNKFVDGRHIKLICDKLQAVVEGRIPRLMVFLSPGSTKSKLDSVLLPAWAYGQHPNWPFIQVSHSATLATKFGRQVRDLIQTPLYKEIFPAVVLREDVQAASLWQTTQGGEYLAVGAGANIAGQRAMIAVLDDVLSEHTAKSKIEREKINDWFPGGLTTRLLPEGRIIIVNTRWHQRDLAGYLLEEAEKNPNVDQWEVISIPAILDEQAAELLGLEVGDSYWPEYWSLARLLKTKEFLPEYEWAAQYMQAPLSDKGNIFKEEYFKIWPDGESLPKCQFVMQTIDTAFSTKSSSDYSVIQTWGIFTKVVQDSRGIEQTVSNMILLGNVRGRWEYHELRQKVREQQKEHKPDLIVVEERASGISLVQDLRLAGAPVQEYQPDRDKVSRAFAATPIMHVGRVWIPDPATCHWSRELLQEAKAFTASGAHSHDDQVDCLVMAVLYLKNAWYLQHPDDDWWKAKDKQSHRRTYWNSL